MNESNKHGTVHTESFKSGRRTYFLDLRETKGSDLYMTITESAKVTSREGEVQYKKHKIYIYKEDIEIFLSTFQVTVEKLEELKLSGKYPGALKDYD
jgi:hypothetical protein